MKGFAGNVIAKLWVVARRHGPVFIFGLLFAIGCYLAISTVSKRFSTPEFCATKCHEMSSAYQSWELSRHHANDNGVIAECIDCHLPPKEKFFSHLAAKGAAGLEDTFLHLFGSPYELEKMREKVLSEMPNSRCLKCHSGLLIKPASSGSRLAHQAVLNPTEDIKPKCVECHDRLHERTRTIFTSD